MIKRIRLMFYVGIFVSLLTNFGCTKTFYIKTPIPSSVVYDQKIQEIVTFSVKDQRIGDDKKLSAGTLPVVLINMEDEMFFLKDNVVKALNSRGINIELAKEGEAGMVLNVQKYRIRNLRTSGFSPYWTFTTFRGDLVRNGQVRRVTFYFKRGRFPVWSIKEVEEPCYNVPVSLMAKEIASKINRYYFGLKASVEKVKALTDDINNNFNEFSFLKVLELGYTNNPAAIEPLVDLAKHRDSMVRVCATSSLGILGAVEQFDYLKMLYDTKKNIEKFMALKAIGDLDTPAAIKFIQSIRDSSDYQNESIREVVDLYI